MVFDWAGLENFLTVEIETAVRSVARDGAGTTVSRAVVTDFYARSMLVLWPTIVVTGDREWQFDADNSADEWASLVTAYAASSGHRWSTVIEEFFDHVVAACRRATAALLDSGVVRSEFVTVAVDSDRDLITRCLTPAQLVANFPQIHRRDSAIRELRRLPAEHQVTQLITGLISAQDHPVLDVDDQVRLLVQMGEPAAVAAAAAIGDRGASVPLLSQVIDEIGIASAQIITPLTGSLRDPSLAKAVRRRVACSLAWLGRLDVVCDNAADLTDEGLCEAIATSYLSERKNGPLDYRPLAASLDALPRLHDLLFTWLSPTRMYPIDGDDLPTATAGLSSRWPMVRRHAAIVIMSTHL